MQTGIIIWQLPLFSAPQQSQTSIVFLLPVEVSSRLPQSVQNTRDPTADILNGYVDVRLCKIS
jgi:hypothetical protein